MSTLIADGWITREALAAQLGGNVRLIPRYERQGLPVIRIGNLRYYDPQAVRAWIAARPRPTGVGRRRSATKQTAA